MSKFSMVNSLRYNGFIFLQDIYLWYLQFSGSSYTVTLNFTKSPLITSGSALGGILLGFGIVIEDTNTSKPSEIS